MRTRQKLFQHQLAEIPTMDELVKAIGKVKNGKAGGSSGILPEMIKEACNDTTFFELILDITQTAWKEVKYHRVGQMLCWFQSLRKGTLANVITGERLHFLK